MSSTENAFPRNLTPEERSITGWMIDHGWGDKTLYREHLTKARVVGVCGCGCPSVDFAINGREPAPKSGMELLGDYFYGNKDHLCGAFVFARDGQLARIEFYPLAADSVPSEIPSTDSLRQAVFNTINSEPASRSNSHQPSR